jgi:transcription termination factor Rho
MDRTLLERKALAELRQIASALELRGYQRMKKADLVDLIIGAGGPGADAGGSSTNGGAKADDAQADDGQVDAPVAGEGAGDAAPAGSSADTLVARRRGGARPAEARRAGRSDAGQAPDAGDERTGREQRSGDDERADRGQRHDRSRGDDRGRGGDDRGSSRGRDDQRGGDDDRDTRDQRPRDDERGRDQGPDQGGRDDQRGDGDDDGDEGARNRAKRERRRKNRPGGQGQGGQENLDEAEVREGVLDLLPEGYGFLRTTGYLAGPKDVYVSQSFVRRYDLRRGDKVAGPIRRNRNNDKFPALGRVDRIEGVAVADLEGQAKRPDFKDLTPLFPDERLRLAGGENATMAMRLVDMFTPIGKGQRGLIVSPPKAGKTTILKQLAAAIEASDPDLHLMVVLVDERPEEVTDFERSTDGEVISSTFDRPAEDHTQVAELTIERAKRLAERGRDVVILLDSITRLGRAYNQTAPTSGRVMSGGIDAAALYPPKRFFGAARNIEEGGSLTIIATALIETGSKMDEVIFEEFKGTGNMELRLDRRMEQKRIFPAIDIQASGTRREDLLLPQEQIDTIWKLRRLLSTMDTESSLHLLIDKLKAAKSNEQFLQLISKSNLQ